MEQEFLVCYDYGMGGVWLVLSANDADEITTRYPELVVVQDQPRWMDDAEYQELRARREALDGPHTGLLAAWDNA